MRFYKLVYFFSSFIIEHVVVGQMWSTIGSKIEENVRENMPSENQIEQEVQRAIRRHGR